MLNLPLRVLFHYPILNIGGAEMSSIRMMKALVERGWDVTLVLTTGGGPLEPMLDPRIRVVKLRPWSRGHRFKSADGFLDSARRIPDLVAYCVAFAVGVARMIPFLFERYQAAATLLHGTSTWFIRRVVHAKIRIHWIRNDLDRTAGGDRIVSVIMSEWQEIDRYVCVSEVVKESLIRAVPEIANKSHVIYNILDAQTMRQRSQEQGDPFPSKSNKSLRILSVCRLSEAPKGLIRMALVCRRLIENDLEFHWFVIGEGADRALFEAKISELQLHDHMTLLGASDNPFPAYKFCDIVAVLSNYEGLCGVLNEAKIMGKAVVATRCSGTEEQLIHGESGLIVGNNELAIFDGLSTIISDTSLRNRLSNSTLPKNLADDNAKLDGIESLLAGAR